MRGTRSSLAGLTALNWLGHVLLALGLFGPCMTITPRMGEHTGLAKWLGLLDDPESYSIFGGIVRLLDGNLLVALALALFSGVFPLSKAIILRAALSDARAGRSASRAHGIAAKFGKYSMVDVFVIALLVVASKRVPGGTTIDIEWGAYAFGAAALLSIPVAVAVGRLESTLPGCAPS